MLDTSNVLKTLRKKAKMTTEEVSVKSGYSRYTIYKKEKGTNIGFNSFCDLLDLFGYEVKIVKKGIFKSDIIDWTKELPELMHPDEDASEALVREFGRPLKSDDEYLMIDAKGNLYGSRLYLFEDGKIEGDGYFYENPVAWIEMPKYEGNK